MITQKLIKRRPLSIELLMPFVSIVLVFVPIVVLKPNILNYFGIHLLLNMAIPLVLATIAQMFAMTIGEIDFSLGNLVSLVTCIVGTTLAKNPVLAIALLIGILLIYMVLGALFYLKNIPSIVVTIGLSFIWTGVAVIIQPSPGGNVPAWIVNMMGYKPPLIPMPLLFMVGIAIILMLILFRTKFGVLLRGVGGNKRAVEQSGHSVLKVQMFVFLLVGLFGILSGTALAGITTSADARIAQNYTMIAVASVLLGGGSFSGGTVSAVGVVLGACTMTMVGTLLTFLKVSPDWQIGTQGIIILAVLFVNSQLKQKGRVRYV
mgnify:CR=1 FL=1